jgi:phospholipase C
VGAKAGSCTGCQSLSWAYLSQTGATSGSFVVAAPRCDAGTNADQGCGFLEWRIYADDGYALRGRSNAVHNGLSGVSVNVAVNSGTYGAPGSSVNVSWTASGLPSGFSTSATDWIGLYSAGSPDGGGNWRSIAWSYTNNAPTGWTAFTVPPGKGQYEVRYYSAGGYTKFAAARFYNYDVSSGPTECLAPGATASNIKNVVVIVQENHSFDSYFKNYCQAPVGSRPTCNTGRSCCETSSLSKPVSLTESEHAAFSPNHEKACMIAEINGGRMDRYVKGAGAGCSNSRNAAYAPSSVMGYHWGLAANYSLSDRYFQPVAGSSSMNNMYLSRAAHVFDGPVDVQASGSGCVGSGPLQYFENLTIGHLLSHCGVSWAWYMEGYAVANADPTGCPGGAWPFGYDGSDNPMQYAPDFIDVPAFNRDYLSFATDIASQTLPGVVFIKALGNRTEHPGSGIIISAGANFVRNTLNAILASDFYRNRTLVLLTYDESGGYYDHISPPPNHPFDNQPYGARSPFFALGHFAKTNYVSHVTLEHSSIVRFIEWNFLGGQPGQLGTRDRAVNNIGDMLQPERTGTAVPSLTPNAPNAQGSTTTTLSAAISGALALIGVALGVRFASKRRVSSVALDTQGGDAARSSTSATAKQHVELAEMRQAPI